MIEADSFEDGYDRYFLYGSSLLAEPFCWAYGMLRYRSILPLDPKKFDNAASKTEEIAYRILIFSCAAVAFTVAAPHIVIVGAVMGTVSGLLRTAGFALQKQGFTHAKGKMPPLSIQNETVKVMNWMIDGKIAELDYKKGLISWRSRVDRLVDEIKEADTDVLVLQGIEDSALFEALIQRLEDRYAHFFFHMGGNVLKNGNGCMVLTKYALKDFTHTELPDGTSFEMFTVKADPKDQAPVLRFLATELIAGTENKEKRMRHVTHMVEYLAKEKLALPTGFIGTNTDQRDEEEKTFLFGYLSHSYLGKEPTSTDQLAIQYDPSYKEQGETYDLISFFKRRIPHQETLPVTERNIKFVNCLLIRGFSKSYDTKTALSSHHGIVTTFHLTKNDLLLKCQA